jgi:hypothetical protein
MLESHESQLMAIAIGLYLLDCCLLLRRDEGLVIAGPRGTWRAKLSSEDHGWMGRYLYLANPLTPHRAIFKLRLSAFDLAGTSSTTWSALRSMLSPVVPFMCVTAFGLYGLVPLGLFTRLGSVCVLFGAILTYAGAIGAIWWLFRHRKAAGLTTARFAKLAFECIVCPPFNVNLVRRLTAAHLVNEPWPVAAQRLLSQAEWDHLITICAERIEAEVESEPEGSARAEALRAQLGQLRSTP